MAFVQTMKARSLSLKSPWTGWNLWQMKDFTHTQVRRIPRLKPFTGLTFAPHHSGIRLIFPKLWRKSLWQPRKSSQSLWSDPTWHIPPQEEHSGVWNWLRHCRAVLMPEGWSHQHSCSWQFKSWLETSFHSHSCRVNFQPEQRTLSTQTKSLYLAERSGGEEKITLVPNRDIKYCSTEIVTL